MTMQWIRSIDWWIMACLAPLLIMSVLTMSSFTDTGISFAGRQLIWIGISFFVMATVASVDLHMLRQSNIVSYAYLLVVALLFGLIFFGSTVNGSTSWYSFGLLSFQPSDLMKVSLILILSRYLARRHIEIRAIKHIIITGIYLLVPFFLVFIQPDFGTAAILLCIWVGMILVSGISKKHLAILLGIATVVGVSLWFGVLQDYQKSRIVSFINPMADIQGAGYNAYQSTLAVGSGQVFGKGVGYGTQSRLHFLPEYETDFIFAAVSEEWGFIGSSLIVILLVLLIIRILVLASRMSTNFELLFAVGVACYFTAHILINIGMNIGLLPVTGVTLPFLSYGGSHLLVSFLALGIIMSFAKRSQHRWVNSDTEVLLR